VGDLEMGRWGDGANERLIDEEFEEFEEFEMFEMYEELGKLLLLRIKLKTIN